MFNVTKVQNGLAGLVGIRVPVNPALDILDPTSYDSESGLYVDDVEMFKLDFWDASQSFVGATMDQKTDLMNNTKLSAISSVCSEIFNAWNHNLSTVLYTRASDRTKPTLLDVGSFYGFRLRPSQLQNQGFQITDVRLQFEGTGDLTLFLYNSEQPDFLEMKVIAITSEYQVENLGWNIDSTEAQKGDYFFGYVADATLKPFDRNVNDSSLMNGLKNIDIMEMMYEGFASFSDISKVYSSNTHCGLNPTITVYDDYTETILRNKILFSKCIQLQWAIQVMIGYASTNRSNRDERIAKEMIISTLQVIDGVKTEEYYKPGLRTLLGTEIKRAKEEINKLRQSYLGSDDSLKVLTIN